MENVKFIASSGLYVVGDVIRYQCAEGWRPAHVMSSVCDGNGTWQPDPEELTCLKEERIGNFIYSNSVGVQSAQVSMHLSNHFPTPWLCTQGMDGLTLFNNVICTIFTFRALLVNTFYNWTFSLCIDITCYDDCDYSDKETFQLLEERKEILYNLKFF